MAEITVDFDAGTHSLTALKAAAYRLIGAATCQIDKREDRYFCRLTAVQLDADGLRQRYLDLVTDENIREDLRAKTEPVRNLILSLAFGSLAEKSETTS